MWSRKTAVSPFLHSMLHNPNVETHTFCCNLLQLTANSRGRKKQCCQLKLARLQQLVQLANMIDESTEKKPFPVPERKFTSPQCECGKIKQYPVTAIISSDLGSAKTTTKKWWQQLENRSQKRDGKKTQLTVPRQWRNKKLARRHRELHSSELAVTIGTSCSCAST